eukprot:TRINITY_DN7632_c1_g1_i5.p1 TRINITY_DN7632_c1_g1~~TRINITY_DN7632_c1_g1_i5.p1  ORF type:complete len:552 (-),score=117.50 TRINITY_DN7632_c1_g1_i5:314-1969(-)
MDTVKISGISLKFWRMCSLEDNEDEFKTQETCTFILPEYPESAIDALKSLLQTISKVENIFPDVQNTSEEVDSLEIKQELNLKKDLEQLEQKAVKVEKEFLVKDEPDFINDDGDDDFSVPVRKKKKTGHKSQKRKSCSKCGENFVWRKKLLLHLKQCNPDQYEEEIKRAPPPSPKKSSKSSSSENNQQGPFYCDKCPHVSQKWSAYLSHVSAHQLSAVLKESKVEKDPLTIKNNDPEGPDQGKLTSPGHDEVYQLKNWCESCDLAYPNYQMYKQHMDQFHKKSLQCPECDLRFTYENTLLKHKLDYHTLYPKQCNQCSEVFLTAKTLYEHIDVHTKHLNPKNSPCEICGKLLKDKYTLKAHVEAVHEKRAGGDFACEQCGKLLKSKSSLQYHRKSAHTQDYPHRCDVCGKGYIKYNRMINCLNNHQGIYKYRCPECDYKTNKLLQFKEHVNMHTGEKSYFCPVCRHKSNGTKNLGCHIKQVHKMTLCQAEVTYRTNRFGEPMTEDQIDDMKVRMSSLSNYSEKIVKDLKSNASTTGENDPGETELQATEAQ